MGCVVVRVGKVVYPEGACFNATKEYRFAEASEITAEVLIDVWKTWNETDKIDFLNDFGDIWDNGEEEGITVFCETEEDARKIEEVSVDLDIPVRVLVGVTL